MTFFPYKINCRISENISPASLKREFHGNYTSNQQTLHVLQWNSLAQGMILSIIFSFLKLYFIGLSNPENNFVRVKKDTLAYDTRKWRILEQILIRQPDLCAIQEADTYECFLQHHLPKHG